MSEPIRTVEELAEACDKMRNLDQDAASRILDYLGLDYCQDGETPREALERLTAQVQHLRHGCMKQNDEVCQSLGKALRYPWFKDDQLNFPGATEEHGVCVGDHVAESLAAEAARRIGELEATLRANEAATGATRELIVAWDIAHDALAAVRGALMDAGKSTVETDDEDLADGVRQLEAERDRYRDALMRVLRWTDGWVGDVGTMASKTVRGHIKGAGLDPDTLGVE